MTEARGLPVAVLALIAMIAAAQAQPVADRILAGVSYAEEGGCTLVRVGLNLPVRYIGHFPLASGDELRIRLQPLALSPADEVGLAGRESLRPPVNLRAAIARILYEGDDPAGPSLTLFFRHPVAFRVAQGGDSRSVIIAVAGRTPSETCRPVFPDR